MEEHTIPKPGALLREGNHKDSLVRADRSAQRWLLMFPFVLGVLLASTNRWFTIVDDEYNIIDGAAQPVLQTVGHFLYGVGQHEHPPLYDILLHGWLRLTGGEEQLLRIPSIVFYCVGAWFLSKAAKRFGGVRSQALVLGLILVWPYGFHFGRLATWYPFCFMLVSLLTDRYFTFLDAPARRNWLLLAAVSIALLYSNYFGLALLGCLGLDALVENRGNLRNSRSLLVGMIALPMITDIPLLRAFLHESRSGTDFGVGSGRMLWAIYAFYCAFVSESVAPWFWTLGISAGVAIAVCLVLTFWHAPARPRRFLLYFMGLVLAMTVLGISNTKRTFFISAWMILPVGVTLGTIRRKSVRHVLVASLAFIVAIGWYGIITRASYAAPHWIEPWRAVAGQGADVVRGGGAVIGNTPSFFFYMTYALESAHSTRRPFRGLLPDTITDPHVYDPEQWIEAGRPRYSTILLIKGELHSAPSATPTQQTQLWLDDNCRVVNTQKLIHDPGAELKQRYAPEIRQAEWRIEVRTYACQQ
jgi:Dolichyl-phosphate-mannose-protein mannosyltransferase